jgi:predicted nucleic acid-binding protein
VIVVDTSVWVDLFNDRETSQVRRCVELIQDGAPVALTDVVLTEILQGLKDEREVVLVENHLQQFPILHARSRL